MIGLEAMVELEQKRTVNGAVQAIAGARTATKFLGGVPEDVPILGDEALFGAMSTLYVRKGSDVITIQPPNLQQVAGFQAYGKVRNAKLGSDEQVKAMEALAQTQKGDPLTAGLQGGDATQGALAVIKASSKKQEPSTKRTRERWRRPSPRSSSKSCKATKSGAQSYETPPARYPSSGELVGYAGIALATVALAGCNGAAAPATAAARTTAASADRASGKAGDPAANDNAFHGRRLPTASSRRARRAIC